VFPDYSGLSVSHNESRINSYFYQENWYNKVLKFLQCGVEFDILSELKRLVCVDKRFI